jgi:hypothetical protein
MKVRLIGKDYRNNIPLPKDMKLECERYSWHVFGGPEEAEIRVTGLKQNLPDLLFILRNGIVIEDDNSEPLWWGYVNRVEIPIDKVRIVADLEEMYNKIAIAYTLVNLGGSSTGTRRTTDWKSDQLSIEQYGIRELLDTGTDMNIIAADAYATRKLQDMKVPKAYILNGSGGESGAILGCKGWWQSTSWRYAYIPTKLALAFQTIGSIQIAFTATDIVKLAEGFTPRSNLNVLELGAYYKRIGNPGPMTLSICLNPDNITPGEALGSVTIQPPDIKNKPAWNKGALSSSVQLDAGKNYFFVISATDVNTSNYYVLNLDGNQGYGDGVAVKQVGSAWSSIPQDIPFRIYVSELVETIQQVQNLLTSYGQFLKNIVCETGSGISTESYRSGDTTAKDELEALMDIGTSAYTRILSRVEMDRSVRLWAEPTGITANHMYEIHSDGKLYFRGGGPIDQHMNPVGSWINTEKVIDRAKYFGAVADAQAFFCERAECDKNGIITTYPGNWHNPNAVRVQNG